MHYKKEKILPDALKKIVLEYVTSENKEDHPFYKSLKEEINMKGLQISSRQSFAFFMAYHHSIQPLDLDTLIKPQRMPTFQKSSSNDELKEDLLLV